jgi:hypothetical protein
MVLCLSHKKEAMLNFVNPGIQPDSYCSNGKKRNSIRNFSFNFTPIKSY